MIRFRRILCPVDFFPASLRAVEYAIRLAKSHDAKLDLLHVVSIIYVAEYYPSTVADLSDSLEKQAAKEMKKLEAKARAAGVNVKTEVRIGEVRAAIESAIRTSNADLLVMGTHGRRGLEKWLLGSVTEGMLRRSTIPVLTVGGAKSRKTAKPVRRILVTTDFSEGTPQALDCASSLAAADDAHLTMLHVLEAARALTSRKFRDELKAEMQQQLQKLVPQNGAGIETRVEAGTAYRVILDLIKKEKIDLLVMNTHGKGMLDRALLGSTSERVVRAADCAVLLIPPSEKASANRRPARTHSGKAARKAAGAR